MKRTILLGLAVVVLLATGCTNTNNGNTGNSKAEPKLENGIDTLSWIMGENFGLSIAEGLPFTLNEEVLLQAIQHTIHGKPQPISDTVYEEGIALIMQATIAMRQKQMGDIKAQTDSAQEAYFAKLEKENPNVKKHPSGFYYEVLQEGHGTKAKLAQRIRFDYRSYLMLTGEAFDQTYGKRESIVHVVGNPMFPGFIEGFQLMNAGSKFRFYFPYQMLAGEKTSGSIQAFTPMIYEIELHELFKD